MTHNIVAQFSCSIDKNGKPKEYQVVNGSIFNDEYNETLDSGVLVLSQIEKEDRLNYIKTYDFVRVFDKSSVYDVASGTYDFDKIYLVNDFNEKENNIKEHLYSYSINLMSETKILEKWQCPNVVVTHSLDENGQVVKKTIYEYIKQYMELYVPKMKFSKDGETWEYKYVISCPKQKETEVTEDSVLSSFASSELERQEHGGSVWFTLDKDIAIEDLSQDELLTVRDIDWHTTSEYLYDMDVSYNEETGVFHFHALTNNENDSGDIEILFKYDKTIVEETEFYKRFNVPCADLPFNFPTLRQLLTMLMQQVGCIPVVRNRVLSFLDFQKDAALFGNGDYYLNNTVNYIKRSLSSDSFVNTLVNTSQQVLDSGNEVICETLGFRDKNSVLLKQKENLKLETNFPIYKVNKCIIHAPGKESTGYIGSNAGCCYLIRNVGEFSGGYNLHNHPWPIIFYGETTINNNVVNIKFRLDEDLVNPNFTIVLKNVYFLKRVPKDNDMVYEPTQIRRNVEDIVLNDNVLTFNDEITFPDTPGSTPNTFSSKSYILSFSDVPSETVGFAISGTFINNNNLEEKEFTFLRFDELDNHVQGHSLWGIDWQSQDQIAFSNLAIARFYVSSEIIGFKSWDITKLIVEKSIRQTLETDFVKMAQDIASVEDSSVEKISKYVYGTVGYSIGSNEISGFSDVFVVGERNVSWIRKEYTYLENIINCLEKGTTPPDSSDLIYYYFDFLSESDFYISSAQQSSYLYNIIAFQDNNFLDFTFSYYDVDSSSFSSGKKFFSSFFVDIWYQPLNSFNLAYVKSQEDIDFPLEQFDSGASGVSDFDRLSIHEQEQVDRIGNEILTINQRTNNVNLIQNFENGPLLFKDDTNRNGLIDEQDKKMDYIIFKRSISVNNNCFNITYVGSKDAVLKDYFTSIRTKYRAYQYVDYSQSVLRKERDTLFVRMDSSVYDGDNKIRLGNVGEKTYNDLSYLKYFIYDFTYEIEEKNSVCYEIENGIAEVPNGISGYLPQFQTTKNSLSLISTSNMMGLIYEWSDNVGAGTYLRDITNDEDLGGIPQTWQIWGEEHNKAHKVLFANKINFYVEPKPMEGDVDEQIKSQIRNIERTPIIDGFTYSTVFWVCEDNTDNNSGRLFYKDAAERINHTVQFIYYAPNKDVILSEHFISGSPMIGRHELPYNICYGAEEFVLNPLAHNKPLDDVQLPLDRIALMINDNGIPFIRLSFNGYPYLKMCYKDPDTAKITDIAVFKKGENNTKDLYFMINDTKSDYVLADYHGILYRKYKVTVYDGQNQTGITGSVPVSQLYPRTVEPLYDEED